MMTRSGNSTPDWHERMTWNRLQSLALPDRRRGISAALYVRSDLGDLVIDDHGALVLHDGQPVSTDTFFNGLSVEKWKAHCLVQRLALCLSGEGQFIVRFGLRRIGVDQRWIYECPVDLDDGETVIIDLPFWPDLHAGLLYFSLEGKGGRARISDCWYATSDPPLRPVRMGMVITHYNRPTHVLPAAQRIAQELLSDPAYRDQAALIIVDNSRNLDPSDVPDAMVIPNRNLGGSGGFMRGLLYLKDVGSFTHALFMDDDAACEIESVRRSIALFAYAITPRLAIAGALLSATDPHRLIEKGGSFGTYCRAHHAGLDMRIVDDLLIAEQQSEVVNYGAWWFFGFTIQDIEHFAFPFFLRGDDVQFSVSNGFNILTMNGIACWGEDFGIKDTPFYNYFDNKHHLIHALLGDGDAKSACRVAQGFFGGKLKSYCYASAAAVSLAVEHVSKGPQIWADNPDMEEIRNELAALSAKQKMTPISPVPTYFLPVHRELGRMGQTLRSISRNGLRLPRWLLRNKPVAQRATDMSNNAAIFGYRRVLYFDDMRAVGFVAEHDARQARRERALFKQRLQYFENHFDALRVAYVEALPHMTSQDFWERACDQSKGASDSGK